MDEDKFEKLLTGIIQLKLDPTTMKDWRRSSREKKEMPPFEDLLDFLNLQARETEISVRDGVKKRPTASIPGKRTTKFYTVSVEDSCVACKNDYYLLYGCMLFFALLPDKKMQLFRDSRLCINCSKSGHMVKQCPSSQKCRKCQGSHHSLLHKNWSKKCLRSRQSLAVFKDS